MRKKDEEKGKEREEEGEGGLLILTLPNENIENHFTTQNNHFHLLS